MLVPIRLDPSVESMPPDEEEVQAELICVFDTILGTTLRDYRRAVRDIHAKSYGFLTDRLPALTMNGEPDGLAFSFWHAIAAHRPLCLVTRVRQAVYRSPAGFRARHDGGCPIHEPTRP